MLMQANQTLHPPTVRIVDNPRGGVSLLLPSIGRMIGNYPTDEDARRAIERSGYQLEQPGNDDE